MINSVIPDDTIALGADEWIQAAADLLEVGPILKAALVQMKDSTPEAAHNFAALDPETFEFDLGAACAALSYVGQFAANDCRFRLVKEE